MKKNSWAVLILFITLFHQLSHSQDVTSLHPLKRQQTNYTVLVNEIADGYQEFRSAHRKELKSSSLKNLDELNLRLVESVEEDQFLYSYLLEDLIQSIFVEIKSVNNQYEFPNRVLISKSPMVNAYSLGEGTLVINLGLLNRMKTEDEIAFILAHEISHYLLDHTIRKYQQLETLAKSNKKSIRSGNFNTRVTVFNSILNERFSHSRMHELQSDSLAVELLINTKFDGSAYLSVLKTLDNSDKTKYSTVPDIPSYFDFPNYPFREDWMTSQEAALQRGENYNELIHVDSAKTHPDIDIRIEQLDQLFTSRILGEKQQTPLSRELTVQMDFEIVESAFEIDSYIISLFSALQLLESYPDNLYLKLKIGTILLNLYKARKEHEFGRYVSSVPLRYKECQSLQTFLNNLRMTELGNITFNYLNSKNIFDPESEESYQLLWSISEELSKTNVSKNVKTTYLKKFPSGKYINEAKQ